MDKQLCQVVKRTGGFQHPRFRDAVSAEPQANDAGYTESRSSTLPGRSILLPVSAELSVHAGSSWHWWSRSRGFTSGSQFFSVSEPGTPVRKHRPGCRPGGQASNGKGRAKLERFDPHRFMSRGDHGNHLAPYRGRTAGAQVQFAHLQPALFLCAKDCHSWVWMASRRGDHLIPAVRETLGNMRQSECSGTPLMLGDPLEGVLDGITLSGPFWQPSLISPRDIPTRISQPQL